MFDLEENVVQEIQKHTDAEYINLDEKDSETTTNTNVTMLQDYSIRFYNFQVERTADANVYRPLNSQPKIMYLEIAEGSERLKDSSETTIIPWIHPKGLDKDFIGKLPQNYQVYYIHSFIIYGIHGLFLKVYRVFI